MYLLRTEFYQSERFEGHQFSVDFYAKKRVYDDEREENIVVPITNTTYKLNALALIGKNASGKTTILKLLELILRVFIGNESLDFEASYNAYIDQQLETVNYVQVDDYIYKIYSKIKQDKLNKRLYFLDEKIYYKQFRQSDPKKTFLHFTEDHLWLSRSSLEDQSFLKDEDSIFSAVLNQKDTRSTLLVRDLLDFTNRNILSIFWNAISPSFINYLDDSIEVFEQQEDHRGRPTSKFRIRFKHSKEDLIVEHFELDHYLSSGTIKGLNILLNMIMSFKSGGYLLIDEIENHLNKKIVESIIDLFNSPLNQQGATLIFSTHYTEIIDSITRTDSIYVANKKDRINLVKFSDLLDKYDRKDKIKSDLILSGIFDTAPSYSHYQQVKKDMRRMLNGH